MASRKTLVLRVVATVAQPGAVTWST